MGKRIGYKVGYKTLNTYDLEVVMQKGGHRPSTVIIYTTRSRGMLKAMQKTKRFFDGDNVTSVLVIGINGQLTSAGKVIMNRVHGTHTWELKYEYMQAK